MTRRLKWIAAALTALCLVAGSVPAVAEPKDADKKSMKSEKGQKPKKVKHESGKSLLGDGIKKNGNHKLETHGKFTSTAEVSGGKVRGVRVRHADRGEVQVTKYKTEKNMAMFRQDENGVAFAQYDVVATLWIGFAFVDDYGFEVIYWFPVDMVADGDYGAVYYYDDAYYG